MNIFYIISSCICILTFYSCKSQANFLNIEKYTIGSQNINIFRAAIKAAAHQLLDLRQPLFYTRSIVNSYGVYHFEVMKFLALKTTLSE